jgi:starch synthase
VPADLGNEGSPLDWQADIIHCNEWHTGLAPAYLHYAPGAQAASVITIHNLAFQGNFAPEHLPALGLPTSSFSMDGLEFHGKLSFLKAALSYAGAITTVSPTYAREIQSEPLGFGFQGLLAARRDALTGILNGIDTELWNPATDPLIPQHYDANSLSAKRANKRALQRHMGLAEDDSVPVLGVVSRLAHQKGLDLLLQVAPRLAALPAQLAIHGVGDDEIQDALVSLARRFPGKIAVSIEFEETLAHLIEAGADMFLMPSRFEPCGMNQMYSQRYGTPPVVHGTGGLADSVVDCNPGTLANATATGFVFGSANALDFLHAIERAVAVWHAPATWTGLQRNGMARDFGWTASAVQYLRVYRRLASPARAAARGGLRPMP